MCHIIIIKISLIIYPLLDIDRCNQSDCLWKPYLLLLAYNIVPVLIGSTLVAYVEVCILKINTRIFIIFYNLQFNIIFLASCIGIWYSSSEMLPQWNKNTKIS